MNKTNLRAVVTEEFLNPQYKMSICNWLAYLEWLNSPVEDIIYENTFNN